MPLQCRLATSIASQSAPPALHSCLLQVSLQMLGIGQLVTDKSRSVKIHLQPNSKSQSKAFSSSPSSVALSVTVCAVLATSASMEMRISSPVGTRGRARQRTGEHQAASSRRACKTRVHEPVQEHNATHSMQSSALRRACTTASMQVKQALTTHRNRPAALRAACTA